MTIKYYHPFCELIFFSLSDVKEVSGKIREAVLNIDSRRSGKHKLTLESPKVPDMPTTTVRDLFSNLTPESVDFFNVFGKQHNSNILWEIEICKDGRPLVGHTIHCKKIQGLPPK